MDDMHDMDDIEELESQINDVLDGTVVDMEHASALEVLTGQMNELQISADYFFTNDAVKDLNEKPIDEINAFIERVKSYRKDIQGFIGKCTDS